jgi:hypothetical protein
MNWNNHSKLAGSHAFLSASQYAWLRDDSEKLKKRYLKFLAIQRGTDLHDLAMRHIKLGVEMPQTTRTLDQYINDAIGFRMSPEVLLYYSDNCFGTADTISFDEKTQMLRIHDLKTGEHPARMEQLYIYAALFCLEYNKKPGAIGIELRIYQNDAIVIANPQADEILPIMEKIIEGDKIINAIKNPSDEITIK